MTGLLSAPPVPLTRMDNADPALMDELLGEVERIARNAAFTLGAEVEAFEDEFAAYCGTAHAVGISSGTEALVLALRALGIGRGDEVIVPANSFIATAEAVSLAGATPRFVDVDPRTALVTAELIEAAVTPRTSAVIPVHLYGRTVDMDPILELASSRGIAVVEDACQAHGAWLGERRAGSMGHAGCFSFYPAKNLGAWGDGGGLVTNDPAIADQVRLLRAHGERPRYHHHVVGTTARLDALQAAVLRVKLRRLDEVNDGRRATAAELSAALAGSSVVTPAPAAGGGDHVWHQYVVLTEDREALRAHLDGYGIGSGVHYPVPIHRTGAYAPAGLGRGSLPVAESLADRVLSLPMHPSLSAEEIERVAAAVHAYEPLAQAA
jgi:dTDP-3-amino-3,4,6-trideoxy-alpha-D-glucose transaminase